MEIKMVKIDDIVPYENNPRHNADAIEPLKESIRQFGFKVPMILDKENVIVAGHTRYEAAKALGMTEVPVIYANDLSEDQVRKFRLVDNKTAEFAGWDFSKLEKELAELDFGEYNFDFYVEEENLTDYFTVNLTNSSTPVNSFIPADNNNKNASSEGAYYENSPSIDYGVGAQEVEYKKIQCPHCGQWFIPE